MKIGVDFDNVLANTIYAYLDVFNSLTGENYTIDDIKTYYVKDCIDEKYSELVNYLWCSDLLWDNILPLSNSQSCLALLAKEYDIYIVTASELCNVDKKMNWLLKQYPFINKDNIIITKNKQMLNLDYMIDDLPENLINAPYKGILFNYPNNKQFNTFGTKIKRVNDWQEVSDLLLQQ